LVEDAFFRYGAMPASEKQLKLLGILLRKRFPRGNGKEFISEVLGREIKTIKDLCMAEAGGLIVLLKED